MGYVSRVYNSNEEIEQDILKEALEIGLHRINQMMQTAKSSNIYAGICTEDSELTKVLDYKKVFIGR